MSKFKWNWDDAKQTLYSFDFKGYFKFFYSNVFFQFFFLLNIYLMFWKPNLRTVRFSSSLLKALIKKLKQIRDTKFESMLDFITKRYCEPTYKRKVYSREKYSQLVNKIFANILLQMKEGKIRGNPWFHEKIKICWGLRLQKNFSPMFSVFLRGLLILFKKKLHFIFWVFIFSF